MMETTENSPDGEPLSSYAVIVGVSQHVDASIASYPELKNSAEKMAEICQRPDLVGIPTDQCRLLTDSEATKEGIENAIEEAAGLATDLLIVYFAGHGLRIDQELLLSTYRSRRTPRQQWLDYRSLKNMLARAATRANRIVLILDTCFAGQAKNIGLRDHTPPLDGVESYTLWVAAGATEQSWVSQSGRYSNFVEAFATIVQGGIESGPERISAVEVHRAMLAEWHVNQHSPDILPIGNPNIPLLGNRSRTISAPISTALSSRSHQILQPKYLIGREADVGAIGDYIASQIDQAAFPIVCCLQGPLGMGKTVLARKIAGVVPDEFRTQQYFLDLQGWNPRLGRLAQGDVVEHLVRDMAGHKSYPSSEQGRLQQWQRWVYGQVTTLVLDNVADANIVNYCLPPLSAKCIVIITSRDDIADQIDHAKSFRVMGLSNESVEKLVAAISRREFKKSDVEMLVERFGRTPQTLSTVASSLRSGMAVNRYIRAVDELSKVSQRSDPENGARAAFMTSVSYFETPEQNVLLAAGLHPGPSFAASSIGAMVNRSEFEVELILRRFASESFLLEFVDSERYAFHDRYGGFAEDMARKSLGDSREGMIYNLFRELLLKLVGARRMYVDIAEDSPDLSKLPRSWVPHTFEDVASAGEWIDQAINELESVSLVSIGLGWDFSLLLAKYTAWWLRLDSRFDRAESILSRILASESEVWRAEALMGIAETNLANDQFEKSIAAFREADELFQRCGLNRGRAKVLMGLGEVALAQGLLQKSADYYSRAGSIYRELGDRFGESNAEKGLEASRFVHASSLSSASRNLTGKYQVDGSELVDLVGRAQLGDPTAFGEIYDRYSETVYRYIYFRVNNAQLAEDLASETFLRALRRIPSFRWQGRAFGAWLVTIARNLVVDHFKSGRYRLEIAKSDMLGADTAETDPAGLPEIAALDHLTNATLLTAVKKLKHDQQMCIVLRFLQGLTITETARIMGRSERAVETLQAKALRSLRTDLPDDFVDLWLAAQGFRR